MLVARLLLVSVTALVAAGAAEAAPPPPPPPPPSPPPPADAALLALQLSGGGAGSGADEAEDAPLESQQGILLHDKPSWGPPPDNEPLHAAKGSWARGATAEAGAGAGAGPGVAGRRLPRYRMRKLPLDRRHKLKAMRRDPLTRPLADQPDVYVVDETVTGYAAEAPGPGELGDLHGGAGSLGALAWPPLAPLPLHMAPDAALLAGAWLEDDDALHVRHRLQKLDFYFSLLRILSEDCRQRVLCEVAREPERFSPLAAVLGEVTSFSGSYQYVTSHLINTTEGARLLSYMEASFRGQDRARSCAVFQYRCPSRTEDMINYDALCLWREMVRWLTIHVVARPP